MQEDENPYEQEDVNEKSQPESEPQPTSKQEEENKSEQELQPPSENESEASNLVVSRGASLPPPSELQPPPQPPPTAPIPLPPTIQQKRRQYFLGLGFGLIPLIVWLITLGLGSASEEGILFSLLYGVWIAVFLYIIELIATIVYLGDKQRRFVGYGLLTAFLAIPVVVAIGCYVIFNPPHL